MTLLAFMERPGAVLAAPVMVRTLDGGPDVTQGTCSVDGCGRVASKRGWCYSHYSRWYRRGDVGADAPMHRGPDRDFWKNTKINEATGCWEWTGATFSNGYGVWYHADGSVFRASIAALVLVYGRVEGKPWALHHCDNPPCVKVTGNPDEDHLYWGNPSENSQDRDARRPSRGRDRLGRYG